MIRQNSAEYLQGDLATCLQSRDFKSPTDLIIRVARGWQVRRLTLRECERLQGFPDDFTRIPYRGKPAESCPDGPRYKALGNSMAVNVMQWLGERIAMIDAMDATQSGEPT